MTEREKALEEAARDVVRLRHHYEVRGAIDRLEAALSSTPPAEAQAREAFTEAALEECRLHIQHEAKCLIHPSLSNETLTESRILLDNATRAKQVAYDAWKEAERAGEVGDDDEA